ncbi:nitrite reductase large subunit NirB [Membranihabitans maritimus]|uniref:nitrite reductase large subunit NirB n=1 Tax=Membranihabitans maritimus TaxID=2904244 RepID=UPI001EFFE62E|nr:nitrite reductase large subunit NirB [Membranihabitans maritimus]
MKHIIVIGNGMVGYKFCEKLEAKGGLNSYNVTVFGEEARPAYDRVHLSEYFSGKSAEDLGLCNPNWYGDVGIRLKTSELVTEVDTEKKTILSHKGKQYNYDYLIMATGSIPFVPPIKGVEKKGVFVYRTIEDLDAIKDYGEKLKKGKCREAAVMGGGLLGLEAAKAVKDLGLNAHIIEFASRLMPRQLDDGASKTLQKKIESLDIGVYLDRKTEFISGEESIEGLKFQDDTALDCSMLVISAGIRPRDELARKAGVIVGDRGGIVVNDKMETSAPGVYAIGEVAIYNERIYGLVAPGYEMAEVVVNQLTGEDKRMPPEIDMSTQLKLIGTEVASFGEPFIEDEDTTPIVYENKQKGVYKRINISSDGQKLLGGILVGDSSDYSSLHQVYINGLRLPEDPETLIIGSVGGDGGVILDSVLELPDSARVCSCENVTKGRICDSLTDGSCCNLSDVVAATKATSGCGGCKPMVKDLVNETLKSMGQEVKEVVCEHFEYNRQEIYDLIKVHKIVSFEEAILRFGKGHGCEVCKPALASIFASIYNETANKQVSIQDSNDRFLANIQRNGSYSVVPRVPAGEITPDKLIEMGRIAKKYDLYTKVTGGQRIDMFGAKLEELPLIWKELIDAGFESGHAYGKALRTVKSCVGSTWCRYGMDESVSFAIELENRYKGIRSPHKIKGGVSGCIRECAEARCKDFGVIAVEGGWNLYIGGNGGANPKHAQLLAEQIDNETCIKYIDRFLMFYIQTAAPLTRTSKWLEKVEGGIDYVRQVVVENRLGIAEDLEKEMQGLINSYECEWKQAIEDPEMMKRFKHFVNSDDTDDNIVFVPMRDQKMPRPWK